MKILTKTKFLAFLLLLLMQFAFLPVKQVYAASTPDLGEAASFFILSSTYTNTVGGTTINGDLGYTTGPATAPTVNGTTYSPPSSKYSTAGTDQGAALVDLNNQACTHTFPAGAVDLATDTSHGTLGIYEPGVYCTTAASAASIGTGGINLTGAGTYIFRIDGALTTDANSVVTLSGGASACDVFWTPTGATTLGANSTFAGTDIDDAGITIGSTVTWTGRALAFGGTVSTTTDTLTTPTCSTSSSSTTSSSTTTSGASTSSCPALDSQIVPPTIVSANRVDADSIFLSWGPFSGTNLFNVQYGPANGNWLYNTDVTGFSTTINSLPANQPMWFRVAARNDCTIGVYGPARLIGGSGFNPLIPGLPNTGMGTGSKILPLNILAGIFAILSFGVILLIKSIYKLHRSNENY